MWQAALILCDDGRCCLVNTAIVADIVVDGHAVVVLVCGYCRQGGEAA